MSKKIKKPQKVKSIHLKDSLTIQEGVKLKKWMKDVVAHSRVKIGLEAIEEVDVAGLQLLVAAQKSMGEKGHQIAIKGDVSEAFRQTVENAGFIHPTGQSQQDCFFWKTGGE